MKKELLSWLSRKLNRITNSFELRIQKTNAEAQMPTRAYQDDAGIDLYSIEEVYIPPQEKKLIDTGLAFEIPSGWHMQIHTRSSYSKHDLRCHLGIVDTGYRNSVKVMVFNHGREPYIIKKGDKFCQLVFLPVPHIDMVEVDKLNESDRGQGGFGSSGK